MLNGKITSKFIQNIIEVASIVSEVMDDANASGVPIEGWIFKTLQDDENSAEQPSEPIELYTFPCAIVIALEPDDFLKVEPGEDINGFIYTNFHVALKDKSYYIPVIVVKRELKIQQDEHYNMRSDTQKMINS